jgi:hypothetical protein
LRQSAIKAGEVECVARAFGLTSSDLLTPDGPNIFLSYSDPDQRAKEIESWLDARGFQVLSALSQEPDRERLSSAEPDEIDTVQAFVALLSPGYLTSPRCREELGLAAKRKRQLLAANLPADFIHIIRIAATDEMDTSDLKSYPVTNLALVNARSEEVALSKLGSKIMMSARLRH